MGQPFSFSLPPRDVPLTVRLQVLFGGFLNQFGWFFFGFGMLFVWLFLPHADLTSFYRFHGQLDHAAGTVTASQKAHFSEGGSKHHSGTPIYEHDYTFRVAGTAYRGASYATGYTYPPGTRVTIEYPRGNPSVSRIQFMRRTAFGPSTLIVLLFPLVGLGFLIPGLMLGWKGDRLLAHGKVAFGTFKSKEPTNTRVNNQTVYKLTFDFTTDTGETCQAITRSYQTAQFEDDQQHEIVYDPLTPSYATLVDCLPGSPRIDERGVIQPARFGSTLPVTILPVLVIIANIACLCLKLGR
ncbi:MAG TPA: DUF3592 domain-containing protein [Verrucomicrobiae bacterium]|nr:DUF3592 domain-containing protein [Verrucomicrobiae bacterium]